MAIPLCYDPMTTPRGHGGFADVWKGEYHGQDIAAKALRVYETSDFERIRKVGDPGLSCYQRIDGSHAEVLQGGCDMEGASSSKCATADGRDNDRE